MNAPETTNFLDQEYLDLDQAEALLAESGLIVSNATLRGAIDEGKLMAIRGVGKGYRTTREALNAWLASKVVKASTEQGE